tara:strand:+ start:5064 stop:6719 length:1656 start_codon:yes stop_codon:yes gene_type:complete
LQHLLKNKNLIVISFFFLLFLSGLILYKDYGISVDEEFHRFAGFYWLSYSLEFLSLENLKLLVDKKLENISGFTLPHPKFYPQYGVVFDLPAALIETLFNIDDPQNYFFLRHLMNFLVFFTGSIFFYKILFYSYKNFNLALIGTFLFIFSPRIFANSFYNNKDIIFLSLSCCTLFFLIKVLSRQSIKNILLFCLFAGLATGQRVIGIIYPLVLIIFVYISNDKVFGNISKKTINCSLIFLSFLFFLIIFWPYLWENPFNLVKAITTFSNYSHRPSFLYDGEYVNAEFLPMGYLLRWIFMTVPVLILIFFTIGYVYLFKKFFYRFINIEKDKLYNDFWRSEKERTHFLFFIIFSSIFFYITLSSPVLYNGWRQVYFLNIFLIYISIFGLHISLLVFTRKERLKKFKYVIYIVVVIGVLSIMRDIILYHPYQNTYFNELQTKKAKSKFEIDYWGLATLNALNEILEAEKKKKIKVAVASWTPIERSAKLLDKEKRGRLIFIGQNYKAADYILNNNISEIDKTLKDKYKIPNNFKIFKNFYLKDALIYEIFAKK